MVFHWTLSGIKSPQVSRTILGGLWMVSTRTLISNFFKLFSNPLVTVPSAPIIIGIIVTFMFHSFFFTFLARSRHLRFFSLSFNFTPWSAGNPCPQFDRFFFFFFFFFFLTIVSSDRRVSFYKLCILLLVLFGEFFTPTFADCFSLEVEWQVSSSLVNSSQYSGRSQSCSSLGGLHSSCYFQVLQSLY